MNLLFNKTSILLESHEQGYQEIHYSMCTFVQRKSESSSLPSTNDRNFRMCLQQDCHGLDYRVQNFQFRQQHILTIINHLTGWPESFPRYILWNNGMEFKNHLMDQILQQLGTKCIFSTPYHPQSNGKLEVFHKYLKSTPKKPCEKDPSNWDKYINICEKLLIFHCFEGGKVNLATAETQFLWSMEETPTYLCTNSGTNAMIPRRSGIGITQHGSTLYSPSHH